VLAVVVGTGRCGSTLVQELLARHPAVGFISGVDDKLSRLNLDGRFNGRIYRRMSPRPPGMTSLRHSTRLLERGRVRVAPSEAYRLIDRHVFAGFSRPCRDLLADDLTPRMAARLRGFFGRRIERQGCAVLLQHLTGWPRTGFLHAAYPELRVIHVVRDGRAVANSWLQMGWWDGWRGPDNWLYGPLPDPAAQWLDVRYEDLVRAPNEQTARMLAFLGLEWTPEFEAGFARHHFHTERDAAYRHELTAAQVAAVERALDKSLPQWGYEA
jgi:hypothetical protein